MSGPRFTRPTEWTTREDGSIHAPDPHLVLDTKLNESTNSARVLVDWLNSLAIELEEAQAEVIALNDAIRRAREP